MKWSFILFLSLASFQSAREVKVYVDYAEFEQDYLLNKSNDTTYVINFWATWCRPCVQELPYFEQLAKDSMDQPLKLVLVSLDFDDKVDAVKALLAKREIESKAVILADPQADEWIDEVDSTWTGAIPATMVIKNGKRYFYETSYESYEELKNEIITLK
ncbi:TlpA family protein disulfide reductase [Bacteroidia bacterium]|nr:TlpA family protein disulfide reductase [Bacteroidia bacterium]MDB4174184.1 TlpA family protein disulfide reductase [Bacteroidia bacterium]